MNLNIYDQKEYVAWSDPAVVGVSNYPTYNGRPVILSDDALASFDEFLLTTNLTYDHAIGLVK